MKTDKKYDFIVYKTTELSTGKIYIGYDSYNCPWYYGSGIIISRVIRSKLKEYMEKNEGILFNSKKIPKYPNRY